LRNRAEPQRQAVTVWADDDVTAPDYAQEVVVERGKRYEIALDQIGKVLAKTPGDTDGTWPAAPVREVIERVGRSELDAGFRAEIVNGQGVQSRAIDEGGDRERKRAAQYRDLADRVADGSPRTAAALRSVAEGYEVDARYFDEQVERLNEGLGR
jgi:hypothetical protein